MAFSLNKRLVTQFLGLKLIILKVFFLKDYKTNNPDNNTDAEEWKPGTSLIVGDSMIAGFRAPKLSRNRNLYIKLPKKDW